MRQKIQKVISPVDDPRMSTVIYVVDVPGSDPKHAAVIAADIMAESVQTGNFHVLNKDGGVFEVDLQDNSVLDVTNLPEVK